MVWYDILGVLGGLGGVSAFLISIYNAKSNKQTIDIGNMQTMLDEAHKMYDGAREETRVLRKEFSDYKVEIAEYVKEFKERFAKVEESLKKTELAVYQGYRCPFPPKKVDCPVIKEYEKSRCEECKSSVGDEN